MDCKDLNLTLERLWENSNDTAKVHLMHLCKLLEIPIKGDMTKPIFEVHAADLKLESFTLTEDAFTHYAITQLSALAEITAWAKKLYEKDVEDIPFYKLHVMEVFESLVNLTHTIQLETVIDYSSTKPSSYWQELRAYVDELHRIAKNEFSEKKISAYSAMSRALLSYFAMRLESLANLIELTAKKVRV